MIFTSLEVWKESRLLVKAVYGAINSFPREEVFGLQSQIKRSVISIPSNIAEGCGRHHAKDSLQFFYVARGSAYELEAQLYLANDLSFLSEEYLDILLKQLETTRKLLGGLINYFKTQISKSNPPLATDNTQQN